MQLQRMDRITRVELQVHRGPASSLRGYNKGEMQIRFGRRRRHTTISRGGGGVHTLRRCWCVE